MKENLFLLFFIMSFPLICFVQFLLTKEESWYELGVCFCEFVGYAVLIIVVLGIIIGGIKWFIYGD